MAFLLSIFPVTSCYLKTECTQNLISVGDIMVQLTQDNFNKVVIAGPDRAEKTDLVFQAAVSTAQQDLRVAHICTHPLRQLPTPVHGMPGPEPGLMRNVDFLYLEDVKELIAWCADIHLKSRFPDMVIVEDILAYAGQLDAEHIEHSLARLLATLSDAANWIVKNNKSKTCHLIITAPSRVSSFSTILSQFDYKMVSYKGPTQEEPHSCLMVHGSTAKINVKFKRQKEVIAMMEVCGSLVSD